MADSYVCSGATMKCSMGTSQANLTVLPSRTVFLTGRPMANISDHLSMVNLAPFGRCRSLGFPATASATAANHGSLTPMPCMHNTPFPWIGGKNDYIVKGDPALLKSSTCQCMWGGTISLIDDGQSSTGPIDLNRVSAMKQVTKQPYDINLRIRIYFYVNKGGSYVNNSSSGLSTIVSQGKNIQKSYNVNLSPSSEKQMEELEILVKLIENFVNCYVQNAEINKINAYVYGYHFLEKNDEIEKVKNLFSDNINNDSFLSNSKVIKKVIYRGLKRQYIGKGRKERYDKLIEALRMNNKEANMQDIISEAKCMNLDKPVNVMSLSEFVEKYDGKELYQYMLNPPNLGTYFTIADENGKIPTQEEVGIAKEPKRTMVKMKVDKSLMKNFDDMDLQKNNDGRIIEGVSFKAYDTWSNRTSSKADFITDINPEFVIGGAPQIIIPKGLQNILTPI